MAKEERTERREIQGAISEKPGGQRGKDLKRRSGLYTSKPESMQANWQIILCPLGSERARKHGARVNRLADRK
eukprot:6206828-Pleurochrysis_carterae.AAC.1